MPIKVIKKFTGYNKVSTREYICNGYRACGNTGNSSASNFACQFDAYERGYRNSNSASLSNSPLQVNLTLLHTASRKSKNVDEEYLETFYRTFDEVKEEFFDGLIITGAPVELMPFEEVDYWDELVEIMNWSEEHVYSTFYICWGAQAGSLPSFRY